MMFYVENLQIKMGRIKEIRSNKKEIASIPWKNRKNDGKIVYITGALKKMHMEFSESSQFFQNKFPQANENTGSKDNTETYEKRCPANKKKGI